MTQPVDDSGTFIEEDDQISTRPNRLLSATPRIKTACGWLYAHISTDPNIFEIRFQLGKSGNCATCFLDVIASLLTIARRIKNPVSRKRLLCALDGTHCPSASRYAPSCPQAIATMLRDEWNMKLPEKE